MASDSREPKTSESNEMETECKIHPFEEAGLGLAPFKVGGWERRVGPVNLGNGMTIGAPGQPMGTCDYCGQGIAICVSILSADGKRFTVGCDCARKCDREDNRMSPAISRIQSEIAKEQRAKRNEKRRAKWAAEREAKLQKERDRNGGLTDREMEQKAAERARVEAAARFSVENSWLIEVLEGLSYSSGFVDSMIELLGTSPINHLSDRCQSILCDIFAKAHGRRGSKKYNAAENLFWEKSKASA